MACLESNIKTNFLNWNKVSGALTLSELQSSGLPSVCDNLAPSEPLSPPTNLVATAVSSTEIDLTWDAVTGADTYNVYRSTTELGTYTLISSPATNSYNNTGLTGGTTYYYKASTVNGAGEGALSAVANATTDTPLVQVQITTTWDIAGGNLVLDLPLADAGTEWVFSDGSILTGASINTNKALLDGTDQLITIRATSFSTVTGINWVNKKLKGVVDLQNFDFGVSFDTFIIEENVNVITDFIFPTTTNTSPITQFSIDGNTGGGSAVADSIGVLDLTCFTDLKGSFEVARFGGITSIAFNAGIYSNSFTVFNLFILTGWLGTLDLSLFTNMTKFSGVASLFTGFVPPNNSATVMTSLNFTDCTALTGVMDLSGLTNKLSGTLVFTNTDGGGQSYSVIFPTSNQVVTQLNFTNARVSSVDYSGLTFGATSDILFDNVLILSTITHPASIALIDDFRLNGSIVTSQDHSFITSNIRVYQIIGNNSMQSLVIPTTGTIQICQIRNNTNALFTALDISGLTLKSNASSFYIDGNTSLTSMPMITGSYDVGTIIDMGGNSSLDVPFPVGSVLRAITMYFDNDMSVGSVNTTVDTWYTNRALFSGIAKAMFLNGGNAEPTGTYQAPSGFVLGSSDGTPASQLEKIYVLVNNYNWSVTTQSGLKT